jgi:two-component system, LytTR family, sensor kinase
MPTPPRGELSTRWLTSALAWVLAVTLFATQWYTYDASRAGAEPFRYYLWWSGYLWALLTPSAVWLAWRFPISATNWTRRVPLHLAASVALTGIQLSLEAYWGWLREDDLAAGSALRHYFTQHTQVSLITYWLLVAAVAFYRSREHARESSLRSTTLQSQLTAARLAALRSQLHPHFLFNTLHAATTLVHEDPDRAEEILLRLSDLLRAALDESQVQEIPLGRELEILDHYLDIQTCRFQDRLRFDIDADPELLPCLVPSLLLQPLVENAVRHGIGEHKGSDIVTIRVARVGATLRIEIRNMVSSLRGNAQHPRGHGFGLAATRERLEELYGRDHSSLEIRSLEPAGVCAVIAIPWRTSSEARTRVEEASECQSAR